MTCDTYGAMAFVELTRSVVGMSFSLVLPQQRIGLQDGINFEEKTINLLGHCSDARSRR